MPDLNRLSAVRDLFNQEVLEKRLSAEQQMSM